MARTLKLANISYHDSYTDRYLICASGPDRNSTYMECWGANARYAYRAVDSALTVELARSLRGPGDVIMDALTGRRIQAAEG